MNMSLSEKKSSLNLRRFILFYWSKKRDHVCRLGKETPPSLILLIINPVWEYGHPGRSDTRINEDQN